MEVLVEDLCKPDVVAAIPKRRFSFIKDKPNLTPDIWERFRGARAVEAIRRGDPRTVSNTSVKRWGSEDDYFLMEKIISDLEWFPVAEKRLEWAKQQLLAVLAECVTSSEGRPTSRRLMEGRSELEAKRVFSNLVETGGKPSRPIRPLPENLEREHADQHVHALRHWDGEYSQFEEEWRVRKKFLDYRQKTEADDRTEAQPEGGLSAETTTQVELWKDYRAYQQLEVDTAKQWVEFWQRHVEENYGFEKDDMTRGWETVADRSQSFLDESRNQVLFQQMRLEWVEQQLSVLLAAPMVLTTEASPSDRLDHQSKMPKSASRLAPQSNHGEKNI
ncbi:MAG: hypothetical protein Q9197_001588 [Variospora fuerteventurae]